MDRFGLEPLEPFQLKVKATTEVLRSLASLVWATTLLAGSVFALIVVTWVGIQAWKLASEGVSSPVTDSPGVSPPQT